MVRLLSVLAVLLVGAAPAAAAPPKRHRICGPKAAKTVKKTDRLRVYAVPSRYGGVTEYVCSRYSKRRWELGGTSEDSDDVCYSSQGCPSRVKLLVAGRWVLEVTALGDMDSTVWIHLRAAGARREAAFTSVNFVHDAVLRRDGSAAWIAAERISFDQPYRTVVGRFGRCGAEELDEGDDIDPKSLRLGGDGVTWADAGGLQTAPLCPVAC